LEEIKNTNLSPPRLENQNSSDYCQDNGGYGKKSIGLHKLLSSYDEKINKNNNNTANDSGKKIGVGNIPLNHIFSPLTSTHLYFFFGKKIQIL